MLRRPLIIAFFACTAAGAQSLPQASAVSPVSTVSVDAPVTISSSPSVERAVFSDLSSSAPSALEPGSPAPVAAPIDAPKSARCDITSLGRCWKDLLDDEVGMWTSPLRIHKRDAFWLVPLGFATAAALSTDSQASRAVGFRANQLAGSKNFSNAMEDLAWASGASLYVLGKVTRKEKVRETGVLSIEAAIDATVVVEALKLTTNRLRPNVPPTSGGPFWQDDTYTINGSFPSGHTIAVWAVAKVISDETPGNLWLHIGLYLAAGATAVTRVTAQEHFPSDVLVGSALGYLIGGYVYRHHSAAGGLEGTPVRIMPFANAATHSTGLAVSIDPASLRLPSPQRLWSDLRGIALLGSN